MAKYTVQNPQGKKVTFEWTQPEPPTDADMEEVFAAAGSASLSQSPQGRGATGSWDEPKAEPTMTEALLPSFSKAREAGGGIGRQALGLGSDIASGVLRLPVAAGRTLDTQLGLSGNKPQSYRESLSQINRGENPLGEENVISGMVKDPATLPSFMVGGPMNTLGKAAVTGLKAGLVSAGAHQADEIARTGKANLGEAAGEIGINTALPVLGKGALEGIKKTAGGAKFLLSKFSQIDEDALKAGMDPEKLSRAKEIMAKTGKSMQGLSNELMDKVESVSVADDFDRIAANEAKRERLTQEFLSARPGEPIPSVRNISAFDAGKRIEAAVSDAMKSAGERFGSEQNRILIGNGIGDMPLATRSGLPNKGAIVEQIAGAQDVAKTSAGVIDLSEKEAARAVRMQSQAARNLDISEKEIANLKKNGTDFGWWFDEAKGVAKSSKEKIEYSRSAGASAAAKAEIANKNLEKALNLQEKLKREYAVVDAADVLDRTGDFTEAAVTLAKNHGLKDDAIKSVLLDAHNMVANAKPINILEDVTDSFLESTGVGVRGKSYGVQGNTVVPPGALNEINGFKQYFRTGGTIRDALDQLRLIDNRIDYGGPNGDRLFSTGSQEGKALKMFRAKIADAIEDQVRVAGKGNGEALEAAWIANRDAYSKTKSAFDMVRDGISTHSGDHSNYIGRINKIGVENLRKIAAQAKDDADVAPIWNELRKGFYDNIIASGISGDGIDYKMMKKAWDGIDNDLKTVMLPYNVASHLDNVLAKNAPSSLKSETLQDTYNIVGRNKQAVTTTMENIGSASNRENLKELSMLDDLLGLEGRDRFSEKAKDFYLGKQLGVNEKGVLSPFSLSGNGGRVTGALIGSGLGASIGSSQGGEGAGVGTAAGMVAGIALQSPAGALAAYKMLDKIAKGAGKAEKKALKPLATFGRGVSNSYFGGDDE